jgi:hypothetical protein
MVGVLSAADSGLEAEEDILGVWRLEDDLINPAVPVEGLWVCPREAWCVIEAELEVLTGRGPSSEFVSSSLPSFRRRRESAADFERL